MRSALRLVGKDLFELLQSVRGIILVVVLPPVLLVLVGELYVRSIPFALLVAGQPDSNEAEFARFVSLLDEVSIFETSKQEQAAVDPLAALNAGDFDLLVNVEGDRSEEWVIYSAEADRLRYLILQEIVAGMHRALRLMEMRLDEPPTSREAASFEDELQALAEELTLLGTYAPGRLVHYYPLASDATTDHVSNTMALIVCFLPFVLAAPSLTREKASHTLDVLLASPGIGPGTLFAGKGAFVVFVTSAEFLLMAVVAESVYAIQVKFAIWELVVVLFPAVLSATLFGIAYSALARSQAEATSVSALYFLAMTLLGGLFYSIEESSGLVQALSALFPATYVKPLLRAWTLGIEPVPDLVETASTLWLQVLVFGAIAWGAFRRTLRNI